MVQSDRVEVSGRSDGDVAAVVVNYNAAEHLERCLSTLETEGIKTAVVVDNGSSDGSRDVVDRSSARWLPTGANLGYGRAANLGAETVVGDGTAVILISNADVEISPGAVARMAETLEADARLGIVGPKIRNPDGSVYPSVRRFPSMVDAVGHGLLGMVLPRNRFTRRYRLLDWDHDLPAMVDWVSGACFMVKRELWNVLGGFDPSYFMYMEDVDLCWRARREGWEVGYEPAAEVMHVQGVSANRHPYRMLAAHHWSMWRFARRATTGPKRALLPVVAVGLVGRLAAAGLWHRFAPAGNSGTVEPATRDHPSRPLP